MAGDALTEFFAEVRKDYGSVVASEWEAKIRSNPEVLSNLLRFEDERGGGLRTANDIRRRINAAKNNLELYGWDSRSAADKAIINSLPSKERHWRMRQAAATRVYVMHATGEVVQEERQNQHGGQLEDPRITQIVNRYNGNKEILRRVIDKRIENSLKHAGDARYFHLTPEEEQVYNSLSEDERSQIRELAFNMYVEQKNREEKILFERYMKLYLQRFNPPFNIIETGQQKWDEIRKQEQLRESFSEWELKIIDKISLPSEYWKEIATDPEILRLLGDQKPVSNRYQQISEVEQYWEAEWASQDIYSATRTGGLMIYAPSGWGKSRLLGRSICYQYAVNNIGSVTLDVVGGTINNVLDKIARHTPVAERQEIGSRIRYCNMAGEQINEEVVVTGWPMLVQRYPHESLHTTTQRIVDLIATTDKNLASASIQGFNRLAPLLTSVTMVLAALRLPLALTYQLLADPDTWTKRIKWVGRNVPEAQEAAAELLEFYEQDSRKQEERSEVLRNKLSLLKFDQVSRAMFSTPEPLIDWQEVSEKGLQVYIDLRFETSDKARELKLFWVWNSLMEFIRSRGASGRSQAPLAVVIDELSFFVRGSHLNTDAISEEFREFVQVRRRNANIFLTAATQERGELPEKLQSACLQIPSQLYGATSDPEIALENAQRWYRKEPTRMKARGRLYFLQMRKVLGRHEPLGGKTFDSPHLTQLEEIIDETPPAYMSYQDQDYENSQNFLELSKGEWLFGKSPAEGVPPSGLEHITTAQLEHGNWVRDEVVSNFRRLLMQRDGILVSQVLSDLTKLAQKQQKKQAAVEQLTPQQGIPEPITPVEPDADEEIPRRRGL